MVLRGRAASGAEKRVDRRTGADPQKLFTEVCLHGLRARLCDDLDSLDNYVRSQTAAMARKVADALVLPQPATA